jgi:hypothetical protein
MGPKRQALTRAAALIGLFSILRPGVLISFLILPIG